MEIVYTLTTEKTGMQEMIDLSFIKEIPSIWEAIRISIRLSKKPEKQFYGELCIDKAHWSRIMHEQAHIPMDKIIHFIQICGNELLLHWMAYHLGYELKVSQIKLEEQLEKLEEQLDKVLQEKRELEQRLKIYDELIPKLKA